MSRYTGRGIIDEENRRIDTGYEHKERSADIRSEKKELVKKENALAKKKKKKKGSYGKRIALGCTLS